MTRGRGTERISLERWERGGTRRGLGSQSTRLDSDALEIGGQRERRTEKEDRVPRAYADRRSVNPNERLAIATCLKLKD